MFDPENHRRLFHALRSPLGGALLGCFPAARRWVAALQAYRREPRSPYRSSDVCFVRMVAPTIGKGVAAAIAREKALAVGSVGDDSDRATGVILVGGNGKPALVTPAGEMWCERITETGRGS
ncbi:MAG: hypothetical protein ABL994_23825, partial [Verrucomicrobiales bacterium]